MKIHYYFIYHFGNKLRALVRVFFLILIMDLGTFDHYPALEHRCGLRRYYIILLSRSYLQMLLRFIGPYPLLQLLTVNLFDLYNCYY